MEASDRLHQNTEATSSFRIFVDPMNNRIDDTEPSKGTATDSTIKDIAIDISNTNNIISNNTVVKIEKKNVSCRTNINESQNNMNSNIDAKIFNTFSKTANMQNKMDETLSNNVNSTNNITNKNVVMDINNENVNNNDSYGNITNNTRTNSVSDNNGNEGLITNKNMSSAASNVQKATETRDNITNNIVVSDISYNQNFNDEITNSCTSIINNKACNSMNPKPERTLSSDTIESMRYDSDIVVSDSDNVSVANLQVPIVGYEVMEERARFTVFKLKVEDLKSDRSWLVFRRYTDFVRLYTRLKSKNVNINLPLPGKRWFRDNFEAAFLEERVRGLQVFINTVIRRLGDNKTVREFLCVEEPPGTWGWQAEALAGALQDTVSSLRRELRQSEQREENLVKEIERLRENCANCQNCNRRNSLT